MTWGFSFVFACSFVGWFDDDGDDDEDDGDDDDDDGDDEDDDGELTCACLWNSMTSPGRTYPIPGSNHTCKNIEI